MMAKKDRDVETNFDPAPSPRGPEEPLSAAEPTSAADRPASVDAIVDRWFADCIRGSAIARHTQSYNHLHGALAELKRRLNIALAQES